MENNIDLVGIIVGQVKCQTSPAGISHYKFYVHHHSNQIEAGFEREARLRIPVVLTTELCPNYAIKQGMKVKLKGFLTLHKTQTGIDLTVLHANKIEFLD